MTWDYNDDPRGPVMNENDINNLLEIPSFKQQADLLKNSAFRQEIAEMLEFFKEAREEYGDGSEGASQRMDNFEFLITSLMKMGEELNDIRRE